MSNRKFSKEKVNRTLNGGDEPIFDMSILTTKELCDTSFARAEYWYRQSVNHSSAKKWTESWLRSEQRVEEVSLLGRATKSELLAAAPYCRMFFRGFPFTKEQLATIRSDMDQLITRCRSRREVKDSPKIQEHLQAKADSVAMEFESNMDDLMTNCQQGRCVDTMSPWIAKTPMNRISIPFIQNRIEGLLQEMVAAGDNSDPELREAYSFLKDKSIKRLVVILKTVLQGLGSKKESINSQKKPRKPRKINPEIAVKRLKFSIKNEEYNLTSVDPRSIIGAQGLIMFNTINNKATIFIASDANSGLLVKGSTIVGWGTDRSSTKTVRKPKEFLVKRTFSATKKILESLKTKSAPPTGRINKHCLLVQVQS